MTRVLVHAHVCAPIFTHTFIHAHVFYIHTHTHTLAYYTLRHIINDKKFGTNKVLRTHKEIRSVWLLEVWQIVSKISANIRFKLGKIGELAKLKSLKLLLYTVHIQCVHTHTRTHDIMVTLYIRGTVSCCQCDM